MQIRTMTGLAGVMFGSLAATSAAFAQKAADSSQGLEEIVVTAQRRVERLQDVPISISVLSAEALDRSPDRGVADAVNRVPGVINSVSSTTARNGSNSGTIIVRGVSPDGQGQQTTAYYLDSIPFGFARRFYQPDATAYDLERVEVLRGPQGTLYGASSLNGVVRVLTKDADLDALEFKTRVSGASTQHGSESYRGDFAVNVPIVEGKLAARAVAGYQDIGGWIDKPIRKDANDAQVANYRLKINAQPTEQFNIGLFAWLFRSDVGAPTSTADGLHSPSVVETPSSMDYDAYGLHLSYDFSSVSLASSTSYIDFSNPAKVDYTPFVPGNFLNLGFDSEVFAQELTLRSTSEGPWRWSIGGIYRDVDDLLFTSRTLQATGQLAPGYIAPTIEGTLSRSFAAFGEVTRELFDGHWELTLGLRYFEDEVEDKEHSRRTFIGGTVPPPELAGQSLLDTTRTFHHTAPRAVLSWHPQDAMTMYAAYGEGFRSGVNQPNSIRVAAPQFPPAEPDELKNYELGLKGSLWDSRFGYEAAVYYEKWQGAQQVVSLLIAQPNIIQPIVFNAQTVSGVGFEVSATLNPVEGLQLSATYSYNDLTLDEDLIALTTQNAPFVFYAKGDRLNFSPESTASASADYGFDLGSSGYRGRLSASFSHVAEVITGRDNATTKYFADSVSMVRASVGLQAPSGWAASLFADNLTNEKGLSNDPFRNDWDTYLRPRTIGLQFEYRY